MNTSVKRFSPVQHLRSKTPGAIPKPEDLSEGQIAINTADKKLFFLAQDNTVAVIEAISEKKAEPSLSYKGVFDASTGTLPASSSKGSLYVTNVPGRIFVSGKQIILKNGDWLIGNGATFDVVPFEAKPDSNLGPNKILFTDAQGKITGIDKIPENNLPVASDQKAGIVKIGEGLSSNSGTITVDLSQISSDAGEY